jgi:23S rRNA G2069 N7-methylase RlmK/C1962 C5-methylase RlmI
MHWKEAHAGHFVSRRHMAARWHELNVFPQDSGCNTFRAGALDEYSKFIIDKYGKGTFDELLSLKRTTKKWTRDELEQMIQKYQAAARELESRYE